MTAKQATELDKAIDRATEYGIEVVAHGHRKGDSARVFCTTSRSDPDRWHTVVLVGKRLVCDCRARCICTHRAAVHMELVVEAARRERENARILAVLEEESRCREELPSTPTPTESPRLTDDRRPISMWK